jgi:hypothetical protein
MNYQDTRDQRSGEISWPFGPAKISSETYSATKVLSPTNGFEVVNMGLLTGAMALSATPSKDLPVGSFLEVKLTADGSNRNVTLGAGFQYDATTYSGGVVTVATTKTVKAMFVYDGTAYVLTSVIKID